MEEKIVKKLLEDIPNKITAAFGMTCDVNLKTKDKKKYIQIEVKKSKLPLNLHGRYYYRTGSVKKEITGFELTEFIIKSTGTSYDEMISDIPRERLTFESFRKRYLKATHLLLRWGTAFRAVEGMKLIKAPVALVVLARAPEIAYTTVRRL